MAAMWLTTAWLLTAWLRAAAAMADEARAQDGGSDAAPAARARQLRGGSAGHGYLTYPYAAWSEPIKAGACSPCGRLKAIGIAAKSGGGGGAITCALERGIKTYRFPAGIFEIDEQLLVPEHTAIVGASNPNDLSDPTKTPDWREQTLFLATRGATDYRANYCHAKDLVTTRVGFVLSSHVSVHNVSYQGIDTIRPLDNGALCGGGVFETKGCAENDCSTDVNTGGSDGIGSTHVTIEHVRLNDYYFAEDQAKVGAVVDGNYECGSNDFDKQCCFCLPNGVRSAQVGVWVPQSRNKEGSSHIFVNGLVASSLQADGINLHGKVDHAHVQNVYIQNTGDDTYAVWGATLNPTNITFKDCTAVNPGIMRPNWYGNCVATYGLESTVFESLTCRAPTLANPITPPGGGSVTIDTSMFVFYGSFSASYPPGNSIKIKGWTFEDLEGNAYAESDGTVGQPAPGKMVWTTSENGVVAPYYLNSGEQKVNVFAWQ